MGTIDLAYGREAATMLLPLSPASGRMAREFLHSVADGLDSRLDVIVTELVTNAVVHGHSQPELTIEVSEGWCLIAVADGGPGQPVVRATNVVETSGRGLAIVEQLANEWGVAPREGQVGKVVWARIRVGSGA